MFLLTHEITNLISQAQDESLFVRRLEAGADLRFHFLAMQCKGYKGVFPVNSVMAVRPNLFTGHLAPRKIWWDNWAQTDQLLKKRDVPIGTPTEYSNKKMTLLRGGPNWPFRWLDKSICIQSRAHISIFIFCSYQHLGLWLAWCEYWWYEKLCQVGGRPWHHRLSTAFHLYEVILEFWFGAFG